MKMRDYLVGLISLVFVAFGLYLSGQISDLKADLRTEKLRNSGLEKKIDETLVSIKILGDRLSEIDTLIASQSQQIESLGSVEDVAETITNQSLPAIVTYLKDALISDPQSVGILKGEVGPMPDVEDISDFLSTPYFVGSVATFLWEDKRAELATMPETVALVAQKVFDTYGAELRGDPGVSVSAGEVSQVLLADPDFLSMLELIKRED